MKKPWKLTWWDTDADMARTRYCGTYEEGLQLWAKLRAQDHNNVQLLPNTKR